MKDIASIHTPVLLDKCVGLVCGGLPGTGSPVIVDCTLGLAGHASAFLQANTNAQLIGIDRDRQALDLASRRMESLGLAGRFTPVHAAFDEVSGALGQLGISHIDAAFMDLGLSSLQIDEDTRGFSYSHDAPLDMRMDTSQTLTAKDILAQYPQDALTRIFRDYGQERYSSLIAARIVQYRGKNGDIITTGQLSRLIDDSVPRAHRAAGNPAKRVFQALRIEVNGELDKLARTLPQLAMHLNRGGRIVVESYHSLEDKAVKSFMAQGLHADVPDRLPVVPDSARPFFKDLTHGAAKADADEIQRNPRSSSVRLRAVELIRELPSRWKKRWGKGSLSNQT